MLYFCQVTAVHMYFIEDVWDVTFDLPEPQTFDFLFSVYLMLFAFFGPNSHSLNQSHEFTFGQPYHKYIHT